MLKKHQRKTFGSWYLSNLLGWIAGALCGPGLGVLFIFPFVESYINYRFDTAFQLGFPLLMLIVCVGVAQWLKFRQWEVEVNIYKWAAANIKGGFVTFAVLLVIVLIVGEYQRQILDFFYGSHDYQAQNLFILTLVSIMPLLGSICTSIMVAVDIFGWRLGKSELALNNQDKDLQQ
jgi:hypothetical protein